MFLVLKKLPTRFCGVFVSVFESQTSWEETRHFSYFFPFRLSLIREKQLCLFYFKKDYKWDKVFKSGLSKFFKGCLPQNLISPLLNNLPQIFVEDI